MPRRKGNVLWTYHLLIVREPEGFAWQIWFGRHAQILQRSPVSYRTHAEAALEGETALARYRQDQDEQ